MIVTDRKRAQMMCLPAYDDTERAVIQTVKQFADQAERDNLPDRLWTRELKKPLGHLGHRMGYHVCATGCDQLGIGQGEWLYDMTWIKKDGDFIVDIPLILESENALAYNKIAEDFRRLLIGRAKHRVMIFQNAHVKWILGRLIQEAENFDLTQTGDRYLFLGFQAYQFKHFGFVAQ